MWRRLGSVLLAVVMSGLVLAGELPPAPALDKGAISNQEICKIYLDTFAYYLRHHNEDAFWWPHMALFVALDGSEEQLVLSGRSREELLRLARHWAKQPGRRPAGGSFGGRPFGIGYVLKLADEGKWEEAPQMATQILEGKRVPPEGKRWEPQTNATVSLAFGESMDYGATLGAITMRPAPQDFADPRIIAKKPIKKWMGNWRYYARRGEPTPRASYAPDFSSDHHLMAANAWYAQCPLVFLAGNMREIVARLLTGQPLPVCFTSPLTNLDERQWWSLRLSAGNGQFADPCTAERALFFQDLDPAYLACLLRSPEALAFAARGAQASRRLWSVPAQRRVEGPLVGNAFGENLVLAYLLHKLCGPWGATKHPMAYGEAVRKVHGTYWFRPHRYCLHRTPDKLVTVSWSAKARYGPRRGREGPYVELSRAYKALDSTLGYTGRQENRVVQVWPDNEARRPVDEDPLFVSSFGGIVGDLHFAATSETDCRVDRSDALLSTAGRIVRLDKDALYNETVLERSISYHSFTSFYDRTCIGMVRILEGKDGRDGESNWAEGFACSFHVDPLLPDCRDCAHAGGALDLKSLMASATVGNEREGYRVDRKALGSARKTLQSSWWCVNDRLGVATVGGRGRFVARVSLDQPKNNPRPVVLIGREEPLQKGPVMVDMAAAYYTDTPAAKMAELHKKLRPLDGQLPQGWKGLISDTPDGQRVMALARFYGNEDTAEVKLSFPEGAPIFEAETTIKGNTSSARFTFEKLESFGQTLAFYASGGVKKARQIGDTSVELEGEGTATLKYLSRAELNQEEINGTRRINGTRLEASKAQLQAGISVTLSKGKRTLVRIFNEVDEDYLGPAVEVVHPQYLTDEQCKIQSEHGWEPEPVQVGDEGLTVKVLARDRSGVKWVDVYVDWQKMGRLSKAPYELKLTKEQLPPGPHAFHAVACDMLGNENESFSVPVRVVE